MVIARLSSSVLVLALLSAPGCGNGDAAPESTAGSSTPSASTPSGGGTESVTLTADLLERFERGLRRETEAVRAAQQRSSEAKTPQERGDAIQASFEDATIPLGAEAAGLPLEQYRTVREIVTVVFRTLDMQGKIDGPISIDLSRADEATKQRLSRDAFADLAPASAAALRAQMDRLVPVWIDYVNLTAVAG